MKRTRVILLSLLSVVLTGGIVYWRLTAHPRSRHDERNDGSSPANTAKVNLILKTLGNTAKDTILEITNDRLLLLDKNGTRYDWRRVTQDETRKE